MSEEKQPPSTEKPAELLPGFNSAYWRRKHPAALEKKVPRHVDQTRVLLEQLGITTPKEEEVDE